MNNFEFYMPTRIVFGKDTHCEVGAYVKQYGGTKVLLHFGGTYLRENGLLDAIGLDRSKVCTYCWTGEE